jgi:hypothetical protein
MKNLDLETRLHDLYATFTPADSGRAVAGVDRTVAAARSRARSRLAWWAGRKWVRGAAAVAVAAIIVAGATAPLWLRPNTVPAVATGTPIVSPTRSPAASPSTSAAAPTPTLGPPKCESAPEEIYYSAIGWIGTRAVVLAEHFIKCDLREDLLSVDPAVGQWRTDAQLTETVGDWSSDGNSTAMLFIDGVVVFDAAGKRHDLPVPFVGYRLAVLRGGGYLVVAGDKLYRAASDGTEMAVDPLPAGYVAVAPTSDPNLFILAPSEDANTEYGLTARAPFRAYLWDLRTGRLKLVASSVGSVERSSNSLAYLESATGTVSLAADGSTKPVKLPDALAGQISPDGSRYIHTSDPASPGAVTIELRLTSTNQVLAQLQGENSAAVWKGNVAVLISGSDLAILDGTTVTRLPLP